MYREPNALRATRRLAAWTGAVQRWLAPRRQDRHAEELLAVSVVARQLERADFDVFQMAYESWYGAAPGNRELEREFGRWLNQRCGLPFYVRRFVEQVAVLCA